jgi:pre-mRNA-splicing factor ATP-dependent RNA helicase DHX38/PRP16
MSHKNLSGMDIILDWISTAKSSSIGERVLLLKASTGSGKSISIAPEIYSRHGGHSMGKILVTQPRVLTSIEIPTKIVSIYKTLTMGENIGYITGDYADKPKTGIVFATIGVFQQQLIFWTDDEINKYSFIVIDECHDYTEQLEITLLLIKAFLKRNFHSKCPLFIFSSATIDIDAYSKFFSTEYILEVSGRTFPVDTVFHTNKNGLLLDTVELIMDITSHPAEDKTDLLVFIPDSTSSKSIMKELYANMKEEFPFLVLELNRRTYNLSDITYQNIYRPLNTIRTRIDGKSLVPFRRVILATNIAETGLTINSIKYVVDTMYEKSVEFNPLTRSYLSYIHPIRMSNSIQRKGRVGRLSPGIYHAMTDEATYKKLQPKALPDIYKSDITRSVLTILLKDNSIAIDTLSPLSHDGLLHSLDKLFNLGIIDCNAKPTSFSDMCSKMYMIPIEAARVIVAGYTFGVDIASLLSVVCNIVFPLVSAIYTPNNDEDHLTIAIRIYDDALKQGDLHKWANDKKLRYEVFMNFVDLKYRLIKILYSCGLNCKTGSKDYDLIRQCIYEGYRLNLATWSKEHFSFIDNRGLKIRAKVIGKPKNIIYTNSKKDNKHIFVSGTCQVKYIDGTFDL